MCSCKENGSFTVQQRTTFYCVEILSYSWLHVWYLSGWRAEAVPSRIFAFIPVPGQKASHIYTHLDCPPTSIHRINRWNQEPMWTNFFGMPPNACTVQAFLVVAIGIYLTRKRCGKGLTERRMCWRQKRWMGISHRSAWLSSPRPKKTAAEWSLRKITAAWDSHWR